MTELISHKILTARKDHRCDSFEVIQIEEDNGSDVFNEMSVNDIGIYRVAKKNGGMILKGQKYIRQVVKFEGSVYTWKAIPEIHDLCVKYKLYNQE